jgi:hypothetical protein
MNNFTFGGLALDPSGNATIDGVPGSPESWYVAVVYSSLCP